MSTSCKNHSDVAASAHCAGCAEPFCGNCLIEIGGQTYCGSCKGLALKGHTPTIETLMRPHPDAKKALIFAVLSPFCFGIALGPAAIAKGLKAKAEINADPRLTGSGQANAAIFLGTIGLLLWIAIKALGIRH